MATIQKDIQVQATAAEAWDAMADFGAVHKKVVPGFVVECELDGADRVVTFVNGAVARERLVTMDPDRRRLVYTVVDGPLGSTHHQASVEIDEVKGATVIRWTTDVLPDGLAGVIEQLMARGAAAIEGALR